MSSAAWIAVLISVLVGTGLGYWLAQLSQRKTNGGKSVTELRDEHEQFRDEVTEHFAETAQLVNRLTDSYKAVFDHLSSGAQKLTDHEKLQQRLPQIDASAVSIQRVGYISPSTDASSAAARPSQQDSKAPTPTSPSRAEQAEEAKPGGASADKRVQQAPASGSDKAAAVKTESDKPAAEKAESDKSTSSKTGSGKLAAAKPDNSKSAAVQPGSSKTSASNQSASTAARGAKHTDTA